MARYKESVCRLCRREETKLFLKGERCFTEKCAFDRRPYPPGEHGRRRRRSTGFALQLREKQKAKRIYGVLESQFHRYYEMASKKKGKTGEILLQFLERRLDNVIYRMGFALSRREARQLIVHGHIAVNGEKVDIPSYLVDSGEVISLTERGKKVERVKEAISSSFRPKVPSWLEVDSEKMEGKVLSLPTREDIDVPLEEHLIVELYSK
jgi:small subunit ribosomal protein S4